MTEKFEIGDCLCWAFDKGSSLKNKDKWACVREESEPVP
jgi:hypothetical protein